MNRLRNKLWLFLFVSLINLDCIYAEVENASTGEFPASVSTVPYENEGFVIEWEDGNWSDFVRQLGSAFDFRFDSFEFPGFSSSTETANNSTNAHSYHRASESQSDNKMLETVAQEEVAEADDTDWRTERKWWQRGTPVL